MARIAFQAVIVVTALLGAAPPAAAPPGLIGHWSFDPAQRTTTQVNDLSGNGNHGILHNVTFVAGPAGQGEAASFNGVDSSIEIADPQTGSRLLSVLLLAGLRATRRS